MFKSKGFFLGKNLNAYYPPCPVNFIHSLVPKISVIVWQRFWGVAKGSTINHMEGVVRIVANRIVFILLPLINFIFIFFLEMLQTKLIIWGRGWSELKKNLVLLRLFVKVTYFRSGM